MQEILRFFMLKYLKASESNKDDSNANKSVNFFNSESCVLVNPLSNGGRTGLFKLTNFWFLGLAKHNLDLSKCQPLTIISSCEVSTVFSTDTFMVKKKNPKFK